MSEQEGPPRPQAKARPEIPPKPSAQPDPLPLTEDTDGVRNVSGKVKSIVSKFSKQDSVSNETEDRAVNGSTKVTKIKRLKRPPTVKPKPKAGRASLPMQEQAPPLPMKSRKSKQADQAEEGNNVDVEGNRSGAVIINDLITELTQLISSSVSFCLAVASGFSEEGMVPAVFQPHNPSCYWLLATHPFPKY